MIKKEKFGKKLRYSPNDKNMHSRKRLNQRIGKDVQLKNDYVKSDTITWYITKIRQLYYFFNITSLLTLGKMGFILFM